MPQRVCHGTRRLRDRGDAPPPPPPPPPSDLPPFLRGAVAGVMGCRRLERRRRGEGGGQRKGPEDEAEAKHVSKTGCTQKPLKFIATCARRQRYHAKLKEARGVGLPSMRRPRVVDGRLLP